eukprot:1158344-Pelagomonas_calceolata.AAC.18
MHALTDSTPLAASEVLRWRHHCAKVVYQPSPSMNASSRTPASVIRVLRRHLTVPSSLPN